MISSLAIAGLASACQSSSTEEAVEEEVMEPMSTVAAMDQAATNSITIDSVTMDADGFVVVHASNPDGTVIAPDSIGHVAVAAGTHQNVAVPLDQPVAAGDVVHVMLHTDTGEIGVYEFRTGMTEFDPPVAGAPVVPVAIQ
jgi:hypothetical protein